MSVWSICGKVYFNPDRVIDKRLIRAMNQVTHFSGDDKEELLIKQQVGFALKLAKEPPGPANQIAWDERTKSMAVFYGTIINQKALLDELNGRGEPVRMDSDSELVLRLYEIWREDCISKLRGVFAFVIWDGLARKIFAARDRLGVKPLYFACTKEAFWFASELKALLVDDTLPRDLNYRALHDFLTFQYVPHPMTIFSSMQKLPAAHTLVASYGKATIRRYWILAFEPKWEISEQEALAQTKNIVDGTIQTYTSDLKPPAVLLSGGVDSSALVAFVREHHPEEMKTFTIGFKEAAWSELPYAREIARNFQTMHEEFIVTPNAIEVLPKLVWHFDEPYGDSSALPTWYSMELARQQVPIVLNGDGGDESFLGYVRYLGFQPFNRYARVPEFMRSAIQPICQTLFNAFPRNVLFEKAYYLNTVSLMPPDRLYLQHMTIFRDYQKHQLYSPDLAYLGEKYDSLEYPLTYFNDNKAQELVDKKNRSDIMTYLPGALTPKVERTSTAFSLELRSPFLDHQLIEYAVRLPTAIRFEGNVLKAHFKKVLKDMLPHDILWRRKTGFGVPLTEWFKKDLANFSHEVILSIKANQRGFFKMKAVEKMLNDHQQGKQNHHHRLWLLLNLELWCQTFLDRSDFSSGPIMV